jgi:hypothetical protein
LYVVSIFKDSATKCFASQQPEWTTHAPDVSHLP